MVLTKLVTRITPIILNTLASPISEYFQKRLVLAPLKTIKLANNDANIELMSNSESITNKGVAITNFPNIGFIGDMLEIHKSEVKSLDGASICI